VILDFGKYTFLREEVFKTNKEMKTFFESSTKEEIMRLISLADEKKLGKILSILREDELESLFRDYIEEKRIFSAISKTIFNEIRDADTTLEDKIEFLTNLKNFQIENKDLKESGNIEDLIPDEIKKTKTFKELKNFFINLKIPAQGKGATGSGRGEAILLFFGKNSSIPAHGDVEIDGTQIEVKYDHANLGVSGNAVQNVKEFFSNIIKKLSIKEEESCLEIIEKTQKGTDFNFKDSGSALRDIIEKISDNHKKILFLEMAFSKVFNFKISVEEMFNSSGLKSASEVYKVLAGDIFEKYKSTEQFDVMLCINGKNQNYCLIRNKEDFNKHKFSFDNFSWTGKMQQTIAVTYKG
jgi:hypothetical protein